MHDQNSTYMIFVSEIKMEIPLRLSRIIPPNEEFFEFNDNPFNNKELYCIWSHTTVNANLQGRK